MQRRATISVADFYRITWQLLILVDCALAVASGVARPLVSITFFLISFTLMTPLGANLGHRKRHISYGIGLALFLLAVEQILRMTSFEDIVAIMLEMVCGSLPLMLLNHERPRSYWLALLNTVVIAVGGITFTSSVFVYLGFLLLIVLLLFNLNAANLHLPDATGRQSEGDLPSGYFRQFLYVLPVGLASAVVIFLAFPRVQSFTMSLGRMFGPPKTGYSGLITLSGDGDMQSSQAVAFLVESPDKNWLRQQAASLHFRGDALDTFDGVRWSPTVFSYKQRDRVHDLRVASRHGADVHETTLHMEPSPTTAIFYPDVLLSVVGQSPGSGGFLYNANGSVIRDVFNLERFSYTVRTADPVERAELPALKVADLAKAVPLTDEPDGPYDMTGKDVATYLALPPAVRDAPYFKTWLTELALDPADTTLAAAETRLEQVFYGKFKATLANTFSGPDALQSFLEKDRAGHCEYFATASALTLRALGVPSRVVVGYHGGTYNNLIDALEVREENAHAWVEAYVPGYGWQPFDPTPPAPRGLTDDVASTFRLYVNAAGFWFRQYVVDYDQSTQRQLLHSLRELGGKGQSDQKAWRAMALGYGRPLALAGVAALALWLLGRRLRRSTRPDRLPAYYERFTAAMARKGHRRAAGETFAAFHARLTAAGVDGELVARVNEALARDLYADAPTAAGEREELGRAVRAARR